MTEELKMTEEWKMIEGFPKYEVSDSGKVRNVKAKKELKIFKNRVTLYIAYNSVDKNRILKSF